jgi:pimeloyl-ACP methyl ester carboxylesterase
MAEMSETQFTRTGGVDIAYQVVGSPGQLDVLFIPGWVSHLEMMWELPEFARFLDRLAAMGRLILFDKRGTGLSDRVTGMPTLEQRADDIAAVMNAGGSATAAIAAWGKGAAIAAMFAATHPERVAALVLGSVPIQMTDGPGARVVDHAVIQALSAAVETAWGQASLVPLLAPSRADDARFVSWYRLSATIMRGGAKPAVRKLAKGKLLTEQGERGDDIYLLLDGVLSVWVDGTQVGTLGPGAVIGERAALEDGRRTATLRAVTGCVIAAAASTQIDRDSLASLAEPYHREDTDSQAPPRPQPRA